MNRVKTGMAFALALGFGLWSCGVANADDLRGAVEEATMHAVAERFSAPDRFEVASYRFGGANPLAQGALTVELDSIDGPNSSGVMRLKMRLLVNGKPRGVARSTVRGSLHGPALVATRTLTRGKPIGPGDVIVADTDLTRVLGEALRDIGQLDGRVPVRSLGSGRVLTDELLEPEPRVRKGDVVDVTVTRGALTVTARARVAADAAEGETVLAENTVTGADVLGRVQADGTLAVVRGAARSGNR